MKRKILSAIDLRTYEAVTEHISTGWVLDPTLTNGKPYRLYNSTIWPLVLYENEEEKPKQEETKKRHDILDDIYGSGEFDDIIDVKDVQHSEVAELIKQGYKVQSIYSKNTIMVLKKSSDMEVKL